jgi:hypothetical protein
MEPQADVNMDFNRKTRKITAQARTNQEIAKDK